MTRHLDTASGRRLQLPTIDSSDVVLSDVAGGLSRLCRFGAQTSEFYSVAQHAVLVATIVEQTYDRLDLALAALHHDSHEAYIGDMPRPLKDYVADASPEANELWRNLERAFDAAIERAFEFRSPKDRVDIAVIKRADECALLMEASRLLPDAGRGLLADLENAGRDLAELAPPFACPVPLAPPSAEESFKAAHQRLAGAL